MRTLFYKSTNPRLWLWAGLAAMGAAQLPDSLLAAGGRAPQSATTLRAPTVTVQLTGYVFEDPNYGGGAGRARGSVVSYPSAGTRVELYDAAGAFVGFTLTNAAGQYGFAVNSGSTYQVRVVNSTVVSLRPFGTLAAPLLPVQTYAGLGTDANAPNRVGGQAPQLADAGANTTPSTLSALTTSTTTAESVASVTAGSTDTAGPDFGYSFDVVVNTNDSGQGSLRQFVLNATALGADASLVQAGATRSTTSTTTTALPTGRETSIFMVPDGQAHPGLLAASAGGPASGLTAQRGQQVALITLTISSGPLRVVGANATLTTIDGGTQTANIGDTNTAVLSEGGTVGTSASFSYTSFSGPEVQLLGEYNAANPVTTRKPANAVNVQADDFTLRNMAVRNFGNFGGNGAIAFDNVPGRNGTLVGYAGDVGPQGPVRAILENNVLGSDASSFTMPSPFASNEGDNGRNNQQIQYDVSGTVNSALFPEKTVTVRTNLIGFSERRGLHVQGNAAITAGYNINFTVYDNLFRGAGVTNNPVSNTASPYATSSAGGVEFILLTQPFLEVYNNAINGPGTVSTYSTFGAGSDGLEINNATVNVPGNLPMNARRDAGSARTGSRIEQNTISNQRVGIICQSNAEFSIFALDDLLFRGNLILGHLLGMNNQGARQQIQSNNVTGNAGTGFINTGPDVVFTNNSFDTNTAIGLVVGDGTLPTTDANRPAVTGVVIGPGNVFTTNGSASQSAGLSIVNSTTRARITQNAHFANGALGIDLANNGVTANNNTLNAAFPNQELDYPILSSGTWVGGVLTVAGFVGTGVGQTAFAGAVIEIFRADNNPANQNGELLVGDGRDVAHGEGRAYLGTLVADANGRFTGSFVVSSTLLALGNFITATATIGSGATASTSEFGNNLLLPTVPLPVVLVRFAAQAVGDRDALLSWATASEVNSDYFEVERSLDGNTFVALGRRAAQGSTSSATSYTFSDAGIGPKVPAGQAVYYRLRQVDLDGTFTYSPVRSVRFGGAGALAIGIYPNPTTAGTTLDLASLPATDTYQVRVLDAVGRQVRLATLPGGQASPLDLGSLAAGTYQLVLTGTQADGTPLRQLLRLTRE